MGAVIITPLREVPAGRPKRTGQVVPWLFHREGQPIRSFRRAWISACNAAGLAVTVERDGKKVTRPLRRPHDFRRTAIRNLERAS